MNLATTYMGFTLPHPLVPGSSPLADNQDTVRRLEDAGAPMIVLRSLFEEQMAHEAINVEPVDGAPWPAYVETVGYLPESVDYVLQPESYLELIRRTKAAVSVPVLGSLNGTSEWGWLRYAQLIEEAGADGLELNLYEVSTATDVTGQDLERKGLEVLRAVKGAVKIPVAVKMSPYYASIPNFARQLDEAGADALVLFNRFFEPDINVEKRELLPVNLSSALGSVVATALDRHALGAGESVTGGDRRRQHCPGRRQGRHGGGPCDADGIGPVPRHGPAYMTQVRSRMENWLEQHRIESLQDIHGCLDLQHCVDAAPYQRANYIRLLQSWQPERTVATVPAFQGLPSERKPVTDPAFPVQPPAAGVPASANGILEVVLGGGDTVRVEPGFDAQTLRRLLAVLEDTSGRERQIARGATTDNSVSRIATPKLVEPQTSNVGAVQITNHEMGTEPRSPGDVAENNCELVLPLVRKVRIS